jgi:RNAse (barnase) inhibitor barstar
MAFQHERDYQRLDYQLLREGALSLYLNQYILADDITWLKAHGYLIDSFDCALWSDESKMYKEFAQKLAFPSYYGENLDALNDCLCDIEVPEQSGRVLVFYKFDVFNANFPKVAWNLLDIIEHNSRFYLLNGKRFLALIQSSNHLTNLTNFGCHFLKRNPKER